MPQGIFPPGNGKRQLLRPTVYEVDSELQGLMSKEIAKSERKKALDTEVGFLTNLQNLKEGLKSDYSDDEILSLLLINSTFTDKLIEDHLSTKSSSKQAVFLPRDAAAFRRFMKEKTATKPADPFTDFFLKEA